MIDRIPPQALDIERVILGTCLIERDAIDTVLEQCQEDDFYSKAHQIIFSAIREMTAKNQPIDISLLSEHLKKSGELEAIGYESYLAELCETFCTHQRIPHYIEIIKKKSHLRKLITAGTNLIEQAFDDDAQPEEIIQSTEQKFLDMTTEQKEEGFKTVGQLLPMAFEILDKRAHGETTDMPSGFIDLDKYTGGFAKTDLIIIAGRPSMGKTSFALSIAMHAAQLKKTVAVFSLEMNKDQLVQRFLSNGAEINLLEMRTGTLPKREYAKISLAAGPLFEAQIYIDDFAMENVPAILSKSRRLKRSKGLDLIIIDYLQLVSGKERDKEENRQQEISKISRSLKQTAKFLDVPVIALSQLSRGCEMRTDKRPQLSDLRESGAIEQDADVVLFLYRPEVYDSKDENKGKAEIIIGKQRNGPIGMVPLYFKTECAKFMNLSHGGTEPNDNYQPEHWSDK
jgi:replicative DNA helicase